ncbi:MAG: NAD(P)-binding domain-containing protein [Chloroflexi bacterium]|nr:NAD(P)-binding domain-containing protein [Chloroflexota bacterium]
MRIIIIGCGRVGAGLAHSLGLRGHAVVVVDRDPVALERLGPNFKGRTVIGVGFDRDVLIEAGIERADGLAAVTASDEANVVAARLASQFFHVPRVVARVYDQRKAEIYDRLGLQTISATAWGINRIADLLTYSEFEPLMSLGSDVDVVAVDVPPMLVGRTVRDVMVPGEAHVVAISRGGKTFLPTLGTQFQSGDLIHLALLAASAARISQLLGLG